MDLEYDDAAACPTDGELAAIELEWPLIAAELELVDAEIRVLTAEYGPTALDWQRLRRAERRRLAALVELLNLADTALGQVVEPLRAVA